MKQQIVVIHGADTFASYDNYIRSLESFTITLDDIKRKGWKTDLQSELGEDFDVIAPVMPNKYNARYNEWKIWFEKITPLLDEDAIFLGHSMGGIFLAKYFSENPYPKRIRAILLVASPYEDSPQESLVDFNFDSDCAPLAAKAKHIFIYHSKDDPIVPFSHSGKYMDLLPEAHMRIFEDRRHFNQEFFPEIVEDIKKITI